MISQFGYLTRLCFGQRYAFQHRHESKGAPHKRRRIHALSHPERKCRFNTTIIIKNLIFCLFCIDFISLEASDPLCVMNVLLFFILEKPTLFALRTERNSADEIHVLNSGLGDYMYCTFCHSRCSVTYHVDHVESQRLHQCCVRTTCKNRPSRMTMMTITALLNEAYMSGVSKDKTLKLQMKGENTKMATR